MSMQHPFRHEALPYTGHEQFVASSVSVLRDGLDRDERPLLLATQAKLDDVGDALGPDADGVALVATDEHGRNPSRILTLLHSFQASSDGRRSLGVTDPACDRVPAAMAEAQLAESALSAPAVQCWPLSVVCLYDTDDLDADRVLEMRRSHPVVRGESSDNDDYDEHRVNELYRAALPLAPEDAVALPIAGRQLGVMREFVRAAAGGYGIAADRVDDLVLAANEIVTNSLRHAAGHCTVTMWVDAECATCEVRDAGHIADPLLGRLTPEPSATSGRGLWLAHHLCDLVQIRSSPAGTTVRLVIDR